LKSNERDVISVIYFALQFIDITFTKTHPIKLQWGKRKLQNIQSRRPLGKGAPASLARAQRLCALVITAKNCVFRIRKLKAIPFIKTRSFGLLTHTKRAHG
jgi:hypothetical protein